MRRREDVRFITGKGRYTDDIQVPGQTYGVFLRSPYARARIVAIDAADALAQDDVVAVLTGADMAADGIGDIPCGWCRAAERRLDMVSAPHPPLPEVNVNYVGEPYALVVAETLEAAQTCG